ncbi:MAG: RHS repeat-associated core domain-containing protein, partial [Myxococcales bacterium]|nr:RHS repeat-associated core domain-containing protein [Myxococcales bacterium]
PEGRLTLKDAAGNVTCEEDSPGKVCGHPGGTPFGFASAWRSQATGLVYMRNRWYSPELGEFLSQDPLGYHDSFNLYAYTAFDPINGWDPFGLETQSLAKQAPKISIAGMEPGVEPPPPMKPPPGAPPKLPLPRPQFEPPIRPLPRHPGVALGAGTAVSVSGAFGIGLIIGFPLGWLFGPDDLFQDPNPVEAPPAVKPEPPNACHEPCGPPASFPSQNQPAPASLPPPQPSPPRLEDPGAPEPPAQAGSVNQMKRLGPGEIN